ncbi:hypothetical protein [Rosistilla oblonga]|uniref:hypothetical protein n=1 Tax=Rosistilla oblonga TaxID=2527990 RepID=UPI00119D6C7B|nr:hypothetical protein [Rosistilla oblonga]
MAISKTTLSVSEEAIDLRASNPTIDRQRTSADLPAIEARGGERNGGVGRDVNVSRTESNFAPPTNPVDARSATVERLVGQAGLVTAAEMLEAQNDVS